MHSDWLGTAILAVAVLLATAIVAHLTTALIHKVMDSNKNRLPAASIFINIGRVTVWCIGVSVVLSSCFNVNLGAAITALGIGGIAISLGFQETLSNLIGGLQIILIGLIEPGDSIKVGNYEGTVTDVTWRHTKIRTKDKDVVVVPNSVINTQALVKLDNKDAAKEEMSAT